MSVASRDPLVRAAAALQATEGLATKPCETCFRAGRELRPPDVYVARRIGGGPADGTCWVVYECPACGTGSSYEIPQHLLLAADVRLDRIGAAAETTPRLRYELDDDSTVRFYVDPADGRGEIKIAEGVLQPGQNVERVMAAFDYLSGGDARA